MLSSLPRTLQYRAGSKIRVRGGCSPDAHHAISDSALIAFFGSVGSSFLAGKAFASQVRIATFSVSTSPSTTSTGTFPLGLIRRYSASCCCLFFREIGFTSKSAPDSCSVTSGTSEQAIGA